MFLINKKHNLIEFYNGSKLLKINWNFDLIMNHINKKYSQKSFGPNVFFENNLLWSSFNKKDDLLIFDSYRSANIKIKKNLLSKYSLQKILDILYYFKIDKIIETNKVFLYGNFDWFNKYYIIDSAKKLFDLWIWRVDSKKENWYNISNLFFSYGLGSYKYKEDIINSSRWVDRIKSISYNKWLSEMIERVSASMEHKVHSYMQWSSYVYWNYIYNEDFENKKKLWKYILIKSLESNNKIKYYSPNELIYYPVPYSFDSAISNSNGMATHMTLSYAKEAWLFELIERDCFILMRLLKKWVYKLDIKKLNIRDKIIKIKQNTGIDVHVYVLKFDNTIPVTMMIALKQNRSIVVSWVWTTLDESFRKTIKELVGMLDFFDYNDTQIRNNVVMNHISYYLNSSNYCKIKRLIDLDYSKIEDIKLIFSFKYSFKWLISFYKNIGISLFYYRYKNDINSIYNRYTIRILSDSLLPIYFWEYIPLQIYESERLTYRKRYFLVEKINLDLQPFW